MMSGHFFSEERRLLTEVANGNAQAFEQLYKQFAVYVGEVAGKYCTAGPVETGDFVQDVFLAVWKYRANLAYVKDIRYYLFSIAKNTVLRTQGMAAREHNMNVQQAAAVYGMQESYVDVDYRLMLEIFRQTVNALPPRQKKVFQLRYEAGLTGQQVGVVMGITYNTVKNLNRVAKQKLMNALA